MTQLDLKREIINIVKALPEKELNKLKIFISGMEAGKTVYTQKQENKAEQKEASR